ncbi:hypothetical protein LL965_08435 [Xanthomonas cassavae CFBP 4642]|uniref:MarR family transcriptional regulator n=1 Tax=Xanthomonas cassavae CFBP 4642 TaxID=1219375 RepID=A0ABS8HER3_9XANT|nr:hypothetical protein [Xanthomonas cassavae]MCC4620112.1 hypothetical protein [Xanthomonas cassavae CFBP 4642]
MDTRALLALTSVPADEIALVLDTLRHKGLLVSDAGSGVHALTDRGVGDAAALWNVAMAQQQRVFGALSEPAVRHFRDVLTALCQLDAC